VELICFEVEPGRTVLRPASSSRDWMDATPGRYAYRCLPLTMANSHGWEMLCPANFEVTWNGGDGLDALEITSDAPLAAESSDAYLAFLLGNKPKPAALTELGDGIVPANFIESHFGSGILTFNPMVILRTAPDYNLWVSGPINQFKDAIQPMSALVETDWLPFTFSMNWKMTRPGATITFLKGEPFCSFFPVQRGVIEQCEPHLRNLGDDPELEKAYWSAKVTRNVSTSTENDDKSRFQSWYAKGVNPVTTESVREDPPRASSPKAFE
jgi:hypothetical protein